jgi:hypothetical protein
MRSLGIQERGTQAATASRIGLARPRRARPIRRQAWSWDELERVYRTPVLAIVRLALASRDSARPPRAQSSIEAIARPC